MTACGTVNLHTEHWCTVQKGGDGVKKKQQKNSVAGTCTPYNPFFITPPCGHSCDCTDEAAARPETLVCDLFPPSLPEPYGASETENGNVVRAKGEVATKGLSPGGGDVPS